jgi:hypothetical protein
MGGWTAAGKQSVAARLLKFHLTQLEKPKVARDEKRRKKYQDILHSSQSVSSSEHMFDPMCM